MKYLSRIPLNKIKKEILINERKDIAGTKATTKDMKNIPTLEIDGFELHVRRLQLHYTKQRNAMLHSLQKYLKPYCTWNAPKAGMFTWIEIKALKSLNNVSVKQNGESQSLNIRKDSSNSSQLTTEMIRSRNEKVEKLTFEMVEADILVVPGYSFDVSNGDADPAFRLTYSCSTPKEIEMAVSRIATVLQSHFEK